MHTGVDFAAPYGTPLKAAGDGVITVAGWQGAYGKAVRIRHRNNYETIYAHMSRMPTAIQPGIEVRQGQVIGFVGSTGRSTGPHAHFEIRLDGKPLNPLKVKATGGRTADRQESRILPSAHAEGRRHDEGGAIGHTGGAGGQLTAVSRHHGAAEANRLRLMNGIMRANARSVTGPRSTSAGGRSRDHRRNRSRH